MLKSNRKPTILYQPQLASCEMKEGDTYVSVHDQLRYRQHRYSDGAFMGDGLMGVGGRAMISSVSERKLVGETDRSRGAKLR